MKNGIYKFTLLLSFILSAQSAFAQSAGESGANILMYTILGVVVLIVLGLVLSVGDNLLALEAKETGADKTGINTSIFPKWSEIMRPKLASYAANQKVHVLKAGHDILLVGEAENKVDNGTATHFAVQPQNFIGMSPIPKVTVEVGDTVKAGDVLFFDKKRPEIMHTSPVSGKVIEVTRGEKRSIARIVVLADTEQQSKAFTAPDLATASREELVNFLLESGVWTMIRQRPFNVTPAPADLPRDIFVSTFNTGPNAPDTNVLVAGREAAFQRGLDVLNSLTAGTVYLGVNAKRDTIPSSAFINAAGVDTQYFHGKHPAGNVGIQIHHTAPMSASDKVWTMGVQEVISLGNLFLTGQYDASRLVALTGKEFTDNKYVRTHAGANIGELTKGNLAGENYRLVSGDVLSGKSTSEDGYLNIFDDQLTVLEEGNEYEMFGWLLPLTPRPTISGTFPNFLYPEHKFEPTTNTHGEKRAFVVTGQYESVLPMDIYPQHVFKSIIVNDFERMEGLGAYELVEEDVALCEFVCTSKQPLQQILREGLEVMREQG
ncbi:MAG: Na+-transporting NADH:ubiquinone oxidoreductase subunit A [Saprospiraceae bacterium]|jgi:Na+-transporting NADH:ubiquinone oxidoreductase subunit A